MFEGLIPTALHFLSEDQNTHQFSEKDEVSLKVIIVVKLQQSCLITRIRSLPCVNLQGEYII